MMTKQDFQNILSNLRNKYGDITKNSDSLLAMLENNFKRIDNPHYTTKQNFISMCDIEADKIYLWINTKEDIYFEENSENLFDDITGMKLLYSPGFQITRKEDAYEDEDIDQAIEETVRLGQEFYGTDLFPNLTSFAGQEITCNKRGAESLRRQINRNTGWDIYYDCPLILLTQMCSFYGRGELMVGPLELHSVLYSDLDFEVVWNGWSGPFLLYELIPSTNFSSFNYPTGLPLNR